MRHLSKKKKLGLKTGKRRSFLRIMANNLIQHEKIETTEVRAKNIRSLVERYISYGKKQDLQGMRLLTKNLPKAAAYKVYHELAPRFKDRKGGYTRVTKISKPRVNDGSQMARVEFV